MAITIIGSGTGTLPISAPGAQATVTVTDGAIATGDIVIITPTSLLPADLKYNHSIFVTDIDDAGFTVKSSFNNLGTAITFGYVIVSGTA